MATAGELLREANESLQNGQLDRAAELFEQAHNADKEQPNGVIGLAKVAILLGQLEDAMRMLDAALKRFPKHAEAMAYRGVVDEAFGRIPAAMGYYEKAAKLDPKLGVARFNLGRALAQQKRWKDAIRELQAATKIEPGNLAYWDSLGIAYMESGDSAHAIEAFSEVIDINPLHLNGYLTLADTLVAAGKPDLAEQVLENAKGLFPEEGMVHSKLAAMAARRKDFASAVEHLRIQTEVDPLNETAWLNLSVFAMLASDLETAEQAAAKATEINPAGWRGFYQMGIVYDACELRDKAKDAFRKAIQNGADEWKPYNNLGNILMEGDAELDWREAAGVFGKALELAPVEEAYTPLFNLALAYWKLGDKVKAKECAQEAVNNGPPGDPTVEDARRLLTEP